MDMQSIVREASMISDYRRRKPFHKKYLSFVAPSQSGNKVWDTLDKEKRISIRKEIRAYRKAGILQQAKYLEMFYEVPKI